MNLHELTPGGAPLLVSIPTHIPDDLAAALQDALAGQVRPALRALAEALLAWRPH